MKLIDYLNNTNRKYIKLGADCKEFITEFNLYEPIRLKEKLDGVKAEVKSFPIRYKALMKKNYLEFKKGIIYPPIKKDKKSAINKYNNAKDYVKHLIRLRDADLNLLLEKQNNAKKRLDTYKPLDCREIVETYDSILTNKYGYTDEIILVTGVEYGDYWDLDEYENGGRL